MKRRGKILLAVTGIVGIALLGIVLQKIERQSAEPFPGAVVILNSSEWRLRAIRRDYDTSYDWLSPRSVLYTQPLPHGFQVMRHQVDCNDPTKTALNPELLPGVVLVQNQWIISLSPEGKTLLLKKGGGSNKNRYILVPTDGKSKPVVIDSWCDNLIWSSDSRALYSTWWVNGAVLQRYDAHTGKMTQSNLQTPNASGYPILTHITPDGRMLCFTASRPSMQNPSGCSWTLSEIQQDRVVEIVAPHIKYRTPTHGGILSPTGERILWQTLATETPLVNKVTRLLNRKQNTDMQVKHWDVCDVDGKNWRSIGSANLSYPMPRPHWAPDGKGIHFIKDGKLCYLDLPK